MSLVLGESKSTEKSQEWVLLQPKYIIYRKYSEYSYWNLHIHRYGRVMTSLIMSGDTAVLSCRSYNLSLCAVGCDKHGVCVIFECN